MHSASFWRAAPQLLLASAAFKLRRAPNAHSTINQISGGLFSCTTTARYCTPFATPTATYARKRPPRLSPALSLTPSTWNRAKKTQGSRTFLCLKEGTHVLSFGAHWQQRQRRRRRAIVESARCFSAHGEPVPAEKKKKTGER